MNILVVDDDEQIRELVELKLDRAGYEVRTEADGEAGLAAAAAAPPSLIVLDIGLPRLNGIEVCERLRDAPATAGVPIILLTARGHDGDVERGFMAGADDYVVKPFSLNELLSRVRSLARDPE